VNILKSLLLLSALLFAGFDAMSEEYFGTLLMHNGGAMLPNVAVPTPGEVSAVESAADAARSAALALSHDVDALEASATDLAVKTSVLNGVVIVYGSCTSFGSQAVEANTNSTAQILAINLTSNVVGTLYIDIYTRFSDAPAAMPTVEHSATLAQGGVTEWTALSDLGTVLTTYNSVECYRNTVAVPASAASGFFRVKGEAQQSIIGQFLVVYEGISVNGVIGRTAYIEGLGQFVYGFLGEPVEE
jgi:hypothetical protein